MPNHHPRASRSRTKGLIVAVAALGILAGFVLSSGSAGRRLSAEPQRSPRLVSIVPLPPEAEGDLCQLVPASATASLRAALRQEALAARASMAADAVKTVEDPGRKPVRMIKDPYAAYSSVAVDPVRNEVVMTDENLFQVLVYDRLANTPPTATMTEPKRIIGGLKTKIEFQCGLYIDPANGDIYGVNNDTVDTLVIFSRQAKGDVPPDRELYTPHGTFGIAVDEQAQEMYLTVQHDNAVVVYKKGASKDDAPVRLLQGLHTGLADPHGIALDFENKLMFVTNHGSYHEKRTGGDVSQYGRGTGKPNWPVGAPVPGSGKYLPPSITVYSIDAKGDAAPLRVIQGPKTQMNWPTGLAVDSERDELYLANDMGDSILVFSTAASGDAAPVRVLQGPKTLVKNPTGLWLDLKNDELWSANFGNHTTTVHKRGAGGDTAPLRVIRSGPMSEPSLGIGNPHPIAYDSKREQLLVPN